MLKEAPKLLWLRWVATGVGLPLAAVLVLGVALRLANRGFSLGDAGGLEYAVSTNASALASTLGILIALVLLMVQLTAQRYSIHVVDLFIRQPVNRVMVILFIVTIIFSLWVTSAMAADFVPAEAAFAALLLGTVCFALLLPYFYTLFALLKPVNILSALEQDALRSVRRVVQGGPPDRPRANAALKVQNLGDIALSAVQLTDVETAKHSIDAIQRVVSLYLDLKGQVPRGWFQVEEAHFLGHHALTLTELTESRTWLEMRAFLELQRVFNATLTNLADVNSAATTALRMVAETALLGAEDVAVTRLAMKFFNTFLRAAINRGDVRSAYHLLYQYRLLAERALEVDEAISEEIARRIAYYGPVGLASGVPWVATTAAYDLRKLAERPGADFAVGALLELLVELRRTPGAPVDEVYKTVLALGSHALANGRPPLAARLARALAVAPADELDDAEAALLAVTEPFFWELTDRVINFDYLEPAVRTRVADFRDLIRRPPADDAAPHGGRLGVVGDG